MWPPVRSKGPCAAPSTHLSSCALPYPVKWCQCGGDLLRPVAQVKDSWDLPGPQKGVGWSEPYPRVGGSCGASSDVPQINTCLPGCWEGQGRLRQGLPGSATQRKPGGAGVCPGSHSDLVVAAATRVPSPSPDPTQPWGQDAPRSRRQPWLAHVPLLPGVLRPRVQSSSIRGRLVTVENSPLQASWSRRTPSVPLNNSPSPPWRPRSPGPPGLCFKGVTGALRFLKGGCRWAPQGGWAGLCQHQAGPSDVSVLSRRVQHWARRLEQEIDGVMRIFGGVQQLREVSLQPWLSLGDPPPGGAEGRASEIRSEAGEPARWDTDGPMGAGGDATRKTDSLGARPALAEVAVHKRHPTGSGVRLCRFSDARGLCLGCKARPRTVQQMQLCTRARGTVHAVSGGQATQPRGSSAAPQGFVTCEMRRVESLDEMS